MTGFEQMLGELLFAGKMLVERRVRIAALVGNIADARDRQAAFAEKLYGGAQNLTLGRRIAFVNVERNGGCHETKLAIANHLSSPATLGLRKSLRGPPRIDQTHKRLRTIAGRRCKGRSVSGKNS